MTVKRFPGSVYKPIHSTNYGGTRPRTDCVILHVDAGGAESLAGMWSGPHAGASAHGHVRYDGTVEWYVDADKVAYASREANRRALSFETQGRDDGTGWTAAQCEALAQLLAWCHEEYGVPLDEMKSSRSTERGVGTHRLGCNGNFPDYPSPLAGREQRRDALGGEHELWSGARGKVCPCDERVLQVPSIIARAREIAAGEGESSLPGGSVTEESDTDMGKRRLYKSVNSSARGNLAPRTSYAQLKALAKDLEAHGLTVRENLHFGDKVLDRYAHSPNSYHYFYSGTGAIDVNCTKGGVNNTRMELAIISRIAIPLAKKHGIKGGVHRPRRDLQGTHGTWIHFDRSGWWDVNGINLSSAEKRAVDRWVAKYGQKSGTKPTYPDVLQYGSKGSEVLGLQRGINEAFKGKIKVSEDSSFGRGLRNAVKKVQKAYKLKADGVVGPATRKELARRGYTFDPKNPIKGKAEQASSDKLRPGLKVDGRFGPATVRALQRSLGGLKVDGKFGPDTVRRWQAVMGTKRDGRVSKPSSLIFHAQRYMNKIMKKHKVASISTDGLLGPNTVRMLQRYLNAGGKWGGAPGR